MVKNGVKSSCPVVATANSLVKGAVTGIRLTVELE